MSEADADWGVLEIVGVREVAERAARKIADDWAPRFEYEDVLQEAFLNLAAKGSQARNAIEGGGLGRLHHWLWCDLTNWVNVQNRRIRLNDSYEAIIEAVTV